MKSLSRVRLFETPWTAAYQAPLSMRFSRQEYQSGVPKKNIRIGKGWWGFPGGASDKEPTGDGRDLGSIPGSGRSPGGGHGNPLLYSCLENPMIRGVWWATVHRVVKSRTRLKRPSAAALAARIGVNVQLNSYPSAFEKD